jgi:ABC-type Na+ efflux pump permease subunit
MEIINHEQWNKPNPSIPEFKVDPLIVLILGFITCGLYLIYWNIKIAEVLNAVSEREVISSPIAVFAGCCYPVNVYFFYLAGKDGLPQVYKRLGYPQKDDSMLLLVLGLFFPMVAAMIVQNDINKLYN